MPPRWQAWAGLVFSQTRTTFSLRRKAAATLTLLVTYCLRLRTVRTQRFSPAATFDSETFSSLDSDLTRFTPAPIDLALSNAAVSRVAVTPSAFASVAVACAVMALIVPTPPDELLVGPVAAALLLVLAADAGVVDEVP